MVEYSEKDGKLAFKVQVAPRASQSKLLGEHDGALRARIAAPPVAGAANEELVRLLAREFNVPRNAVEISAGKTSKLKMVKVIGGKVNVLEKLSKQT
jgi:uncharacterized protein